MIQTRLPRVLRHLVLTVALTLAGAPLLAPAQINSGPPGLLNYQGYLTDAGGFPLGNGNPTHYPVQFRIYNDPTASGVTNLIWGEQQFVTVDRGYFTVLLGVGTPLAATPWTNNLAGLFSAADASTRFVGLTVSNLSTVEILPRLRLLAAPYAFLAANSATAGYATNAGYASNLVNAAGSTLLNASGNTVNITGNVNLGANTITGNGSGLTTLNASQLSAGTVADARLSGNVALRGGGNAFTGNQTISSGNVGIGTANPLHSLDVYGNAFVGRAQSGVVFTELADTLYLGSSRKYLSTTLGANVNGSTDWLNLMFHPLSAGLMFGTSGTNDASPHSAPNPLMVIRSSGNVGIGTANPQSLLQVAGPVQINGLVRMGSETGTSEAPNRSGLIVRRINSTVTTAGSVVAIGSGGNVSLERDGTSGGLRLRYPNGPQNYSYVLETISNTGVKTTSCAGNFGGAAGFITALVADASSIAYVHLCLGDPVNAGDFTEITLMRFVYGGNNLATWIGTMNSTVNQ